MFVKASEKQVVEVIVRQPVVFGEPLYIGGTHPSRPIEECRFPPPLSVPVLRVEGVGLRGDRDGVTWRRKPVSDATLQSPRSPLSLGRKPQGPLSDRRNNRVWTREVDETIGDSGRFLGEEESTRL